jgi:hypothetical protein
MATPTQVLGSLIVLGALGAGAFAPAAAQAQPAAAKPCDGVVLTGMNWATPTMTIFRVRNTTAEEVTGTFQLRGGAQARTITVPAQSEVFVGVTGDVTVNRALHGEFRWTGQDGYTSCGINKMGNSVFATGHVKIEVTATGDTQQIPPGLQVVGTSSIESITWTWDGEAFVADGDRGGQHGWFVHETAAQFGLAPHWGVLDVPMTQSYEITHDELPAGVSLALAEAPGTVPSFDESRQDDPEYIDAADHFWYPEGGKYQSNAVVVAGQAEEVDPEQPAPPVAPEDPAPPVAPQDPAPPVDPQQPAAPEASRPAELPQTGAGLAPALLGLAGLSTLAGAGLVAAARR